MEGLSAEGKKVLAIAFLMAFWWMTEAIPLYATALIPLAAFPLLGIMRAGDLASSYGHHYIYFFMGGFFLAKAIEKWNLHGRMALSIISFVGTSPRGIIFGIMAATAFLSMWISDTASTMVMFPIGLAILFHVENALKLSPSENDLDYKNFASCLILSIAYASLIGGIGTLIGTPPNIVFASAIKTLYPEAPEVTFFKWMMVGLPLTLVFLPLTWVYLTRFALPVKLAEIPGGQELIQNKRKELGLMTKGEKFTSVIFILAIIGWVFRKNIEVGAFTIPGWAPLFGLENHVNDSTVAILAALILFILPVDLKKKEFVLDWEHAKEIPWGILILFGGGIALASAIQSSGLSQWIGEGLAVLEGLPIVLVILGICLVMTFLTQVTSNTAISTVFMPIMGSMAVAMEVNPMLFMVPTAMAASCAFMLPVATPPTAIVFGSGYISITQMAKAGLGLNLIGALLITLVVYLIAVPVLGISFSGLPHWVGF
ncbi:MAG TPA: SLC13 family permease [Nitrospiria bacterium]|jgi:sodium-dependent dicarboxylate transporter 2/3/5